MYRQRQPQFRPIQTPPASRASIQENLISCTVNFGLTVSDNSYLFVGSGQPTFELFADDDWKSVELLMQQVGKRRSYVDKILSDKVYDDFFTVRGIPAIPGSTLKGVTRSRIELMFKPAKNAVPSDFIRIGGRPSWRHKHIYQENIILRECDSPPNSVCVVCDMFGAPGLLSKVKFSDAELTDAKKLKGATDFMVLDFGRGKLRRIKAIKPGTDFTFVTNCLNMTPEQMGLLFMGLNTDVGRPVLMGAYKYRPVNVIGKGLIWFGRVIVKPISITSRSIVNGIVEEKVLDIKDFTDKCCYAAKSAFTEYLNRIDDVKETEDLWIKRGR